MPYGDIVYTNVYMKPRTMYSADDDEFQGRPSLAHGETMDALNFASFVICLEIWRTKASTKTYTTSRGTIRWMLKPNVGSQVLRVVL